MTHYDYQGLWEKKTFVWMYKFENWDSVNVMIYKNDMKKEDKHPDFLWMVWGNEVAFYFKEFDWKDWKVKSLSSSKPVQIEGGDYWLNIYKGTKEKWPEYSMIFKFAWESNDEVKDWEEEDW